MNDSNWVLSRTIARVAAAFSARGYPHGTKLRTAHNFSIRNLRIVGLVNLTVLVLVLRYQLVQARKLQAQDFTTSSQGSLQGPNGKAHRSRRRLWPRGPSQADGARRST